MRDCGASRCTERRAAARRSGVSRNFRPFYRSTSTPPIHQPASLGKVSAQFWSTVPPAAPDGSVERIVATQPAEMAFVQSIRSRPSRLLNRSPETSDFCLCERLSALRFYRAVHCAPTARFPERKAMSSLENPPKMPHGTAGSFILLYERTAFPHPFAYTNPLTSARREAVSSPRPNPTDDSFN
jgi:hypothetical protein